MSTLISIETQAENSIETPADVTPQTPIASPDFNVEDFLAQEHDKDLLRFSTAGSVDDGKSTLIGRLLYDTQSVYDDQVNSIKGKGTVVGGQLDLALLTDGLRAEREQGITIDVAYRYFSTATRKFIIADTPGHEQYTRNMATGASTADVAVVLVDARKGVLIQSRRHAYITSLLGVRHIIVAVNKMDLVDYSESTFEGIRAEFSAFFHDLAASDSTLLSSQLYYVPVSALTGDNVVVPTAAMPWYTGPSLLELLELIPATEAVRTAPFRLAVQRVIRPNLDFRSFAGQIASGTIRRGDPVMVLPSRRTSRVRSIVTFDGELEEAYAPLSISLTLEDEIDISRGDILVDPQHPATTVQRFNASLVWMDSEPLSLSRRYLLKHTSRSVLAQVKTLHHTVDIASLEEQTATTLTMNGIGLVELNVLQPLAVDRYNENRITGSFVLIHPDTNATVAAGMIRDVLHSDEASEGKTQPSAPVTTEDRIARWGHTGAAIALSGPISFADAIERTLFQQGAFVLRLDHTDHALTAKLTQAGALAVTLDSSNATLRAHIDEHTVTLPSNNGDNPDLGSAVAAVLEALQTKGILRNPKSARQDRGVQ
jgi:sulfate adenylyltransferase large subunit